MKNATVKNEQVNVINRDGEGNVISTAFPVSERTKKDQSKTSVLYTLIAVILHVLAFLPVVIMPIILAVTTYKLAPYYTFWHFIAVIVAVVFAIIYAVVLILVTRKSSKSNIAMQTVKVAITFTCLTTVFGLIMTYALPDIISKATQNTLFVEDIYAGGEAQAERNIQLDRDFIMYNVLNGNLNKYGEENGDFSYSTLSKREESSLGVLQNYTNKEINDNFKSYKTDYSKGVKDPADNLQKKVIDVMKEQQPRKYELYSFVYNTYVLNDFDYALYNNIDRRAFALSIVDYIYNHADYENLLKQGFKNKKLKQLFDTNFDSFNQDGYQPFDDPLLLYAQQSGRMTVPVVLRLILNEGWMSSQGAYDESGKLQFSEEGNFLYEMYDAATKEAFEKDGGVYDRTGTLLGADGKEYEEKYGYNKDGWMVFKNGVVKRPMKWLVLDMLGSPMSIASVDLFGLLGGLVEGLDLTSLINQFLPYLGKIFDSVGGLLTEDVGALIQDVTGGANLRLNICLDDANQLAIGISPMNAQYGMLGYMQASWVQSNNLLMAVINLIGSRTWFVLFGAIGVVLVIAAGIMRECAKKTRLRTAVSRDRIMREQTAKRIADGELDPAQLDEHELLAEGLTMDDVLAIENARQGDGQTAPAGEAKAKKGKKAKKSVDDIDLENLDDINLDDVDLDGIDLDGMDLEDLEEEKPKKQKKSKGKKNQESEQVADVGVDEIPVEPAPEAPAVAEESTADVTSEDSAPAQDEPKSKKSKKKKDKKNKDDEFDDIDLADLDDIDLDDIEGIDLGDGDGGSPKKKKR